MRSARRRWRSSAGPPRWARSRFTPGWPERLRDRLT
jgi:hypothetical protein